MPLERDQRIHGLAQCAKLGGAAQFGKIDHKGTAGHPSCQENFFKVAGELGWTYPFLPQSISWFTNIPIHEDGQIDWDPSPAKAGDYVVLKAEMDCDVIVCSCAQDIVPINCNNPTPLAIELL